ncbi:MAG: aminopeptidase N, partial [Caldimonas sp.]
PLDLERFMIVAVGDFNMGAMENKGLNLFNTKYVLANPATATDGDYSAIESVVGHEYFHNWTGNRITCRDWFQLSLKEGLTVFRDQEFSMDMVANASARATVRIANVRSLRQVQFPEDAGPMAHPVRPDSYVEINNFYTPTVYEKGAEVVRMMQTLVGRAGFARGITLYFERHDGQAVTCDDFAQAISDANPGSELSKRLPQFKRWYAQAGTPRLTARGRYDAPSRTYTLGLEQSPGASAGAAKEPFVIPMAIGLLARDGRAMTLRLEDEAASASASNRVLVLDEAKAFFTFVDIDEPPVLSLLRGFSAPVCLVDGLGDADLIVLLGHDSDPFNRWEAGQRLAMNRLLGAVKGDVDAPLDAPFIESMREMLRNPALDPAFKELVLTLPSETYIAEQLASVDPQRIHAARESMKQQLATALIADWQWAFDAHQVVGGYSPDPVSAGHRALANLALTMLCIAAGQSGDPVWPGRAWQRFKDASNMTDRQGALMALLASGSLMADAAFERFHAQFKDDPLVLDKWFTLQATEQEHDGRVFERVKRLLKHPDFTLTNPNRARSLIGSFCLGNPAGFHRPDGAGYGFWVDRVLESDAINPQFASRIARALDRWTQLAEPYRGAAHAAIARVAAHPRLSTDTLEIVSRALAGA